MGEMKTKLTEKIIIMVQFYGDYPTALGALQHSVNKTTPLENTCSRVIEYSSC